MTLEWKQIGKEIITAQYGKNSASHKATGTTDVINIALLVPKKVYLCWARMPPAVHDLTKLQTESPCDPNH